MKRFLVVFHTAVYFVFALSPSAFAYLDPGTGSMILQAVIAGLVTIGIFWRNLHTFIKRKLFKRKQENPDE